MGDDGDGEFLDVIGSHEAAAIEEREGLRDFHELDRCARAGTELDALHAAGGFDEFDDVALEFIADGHVARGGADFEGFFEAGAGLDGLEWMLMLLRTKDRDFFFGGDVAEADLQRETVHLRFGQWISAPELDGVLRGDDEEEFGQCAALAFDADLVFGHGFEQGALRAGRGAVDFVGEEDVREDWAFVEFEFLLALMIDRNAEDVGRQNVGRELNTLELRVDGGGEGFGECGLASAGIIFEQNVAAAREGGQEFADGRALAANDRFDIVGDAVEELPWFKLLHTYWIARKGKSCALKV